eukprot:7965837-Alexandrium_andersonii.AAC.1
MSASLVGSEMCIRDSPCEAPSCNCPHACLLALGKLVAEILAPLGMHAMAVSYTHLTLPTICSV